MATETLHLRQLKDIPALRQIFSLLLVAGAVAAGIAMFSWSQKPALAPVFSSLGDRDAAEVADALRAANIPFQIDATSGLVSVPAAQVHEARLKLASQGLPRGAAQGFELIQQEQGFGTSQLIEGARYQHALETELARTISGLQPVSNARVHLAIPKASAFARQNETPSASVLVELRGGRNLEQGQVASIVHLIASSVAGMPASGVSVIDQNGRLLTRRGEGDDMAMTGEQYDYTRRIERDLAFRIEQLLTPMVGAGRISAEVAAEVDFAVTEEARESYNPNPQAVRSEQSSENNNRGNSGPQGVPGATSNQPPEPAKTAPIGSTTANSAELTTQSKQMTRNYELDKTLSHTRQAAGGVKRLSVAVLVDHRPQIDKDGKVTLVALTTEELAKVEQLVKQAVGFNATRGDSLSVQNAPFMQTEALGEAPELAIWQKPEFQSWGRSGIGALVVLILIFTVLRPMLKNLMQAPIMPMPQAALAAPGAEGGLAKLSASDIEDRLSLSAPNNPAQQQYEDRLQAARAAVAQDPKRVAQVVKNWVGTE